MKTIPWPKELCPCTPEAVRKLGWKMVGNPTDSELASITQLLGWNPLDEGLLDIEETEDRQDSV